jgi:hypothetical protein
MAMISSSRDIDQFLDMLLNKMLKAGAIKDNQQKNEIKALLKPAIENAGGFNPDKPDAINTLKQAVVTAALCSRVAPQLGFKNFNALQKEAVNLITIGLKDKPTPEEKSKYGIGMGYLLVLEKNPQLNVNLELAFKNPKTMTMDERKQFSDDLEKVLPLMNAMGMNPMDAAKLAGAIKEMKLELAKDPTKVKTPDENKELENSMTALFGMDPSTPGKITGPIQCMMGNAMGIADNFPAMGAEPIHGYSGDLLNATMQAATGQYQLEKDRDADLGEVFSEDNAKDPSALTQEAPSKDEPTAAEALTTAFESLVTESVSETFNAKDNKELNAPAAAVQEEETYKPKTPFDAKHKPTPTS